MGIGAYVAQSGLGFEKLRAHEVDERAQLRRPVLTRWPKHAEGALILVEVVQHRHQFAGRNGITHHEVRKAGDSKAIAGEVKQGLGGVAYHRGR